MRNILGGISGLTGEGDFAVYPVVLGLQLF